MGMSSKKHKNPTIRFNGFTDAWEQRKLEDLAESFNYGLNASAMEFDGENKYIRITDIDEYSHRFIESGLTSPNTDLSNADDYLLKEGDILFARTGASVGKSYQYEPLDGKVYYAGFLIRARIKPEFHSSFIFQNTLTEKYNNFIKITSQRSGQPGVNAQEYANFSIMVPSRGEQVKLGNFFKQLDNAIDLHQRKLDKTKSLKSAYLLEMFPAEGERKPKRRFAGFTDDWEQRKLIDVAEMFDNLRIPVTASDRVEGNTAYYGANGIQDYVDGFTHDGEFVLIAEDGANDLINYPVNYVKGKIWVNNHAHVVSGKKSELDNLFLTARIKSMNISHWLVGGGRAKLNGDVLKKIPLTLPIYEEQKKIGAFFKQLDDAIALHQHKLEKLKNIKQAYLNELFV